MATTRVRLLSLPSHLIREAERLAKQEGRTKTEVLREALRRYGQEQRWRGLQRYGAGRVRKVGMRQAGVVRTVDLFGHLKFDPPSVRDACRRVEDLYGDEVSPVVVVEDDARLVLVALGDGH